MNDNFAAVLPRTVEDIAIYKHALFEHMDVHCPLTEAERYVSKARMDAQLTKLHALLTNLDQVEHEFKTFCEPLPGLVTQVYEAIKAASTKAFKEDDVVALRALFPTDFVTEVSSWMQTCAKSRMIKDAARQTRAGAIATIKLIEVMLFPLEPYQPEDRERQLAQASTMSHNLGLTATLTKELVNKTMKQGAECEALHVDLSRRFRKYLGR